MKKNILIVLAFVGLFVLSFTAVRAVNEEVLIAQLKAELERGNVPERRYRSAIRKTITTWRSLSPGVYDLGLPEMEIQRVGYPARFEKSKLATYSLLDLNLVKFYEVEIGKLLIVVKDYDEEESEKDLPNPIYGSGYVEGNPLEEVSSNNSGGKVIGHSGNPLERPKAIHPAARAILEKFGWLAVHEALQAEATALLESWKTEGLHVLPFDQKIKLFFEH